MGGLDGKGCFPGRNNFLKDFIYLFSERGERRKKRERETFTWERNIAPLPLVRTLSRDQTCNQACGLAGNWTSDLSLHGTKPNQLSHTSHGSGRNNSWSHSAPVYPHSGHSHRRWCRLSFQEDGLTSPMWPSAHRRQAATQTSKAAPLSSIHLFKYFLLIMLLQLS